MLSERVGVCPCCIKATNHASTDIFVDRDNEGVLTNMYIFGDDDFDVAPSDQLVTDVQFSEDGKNVVGMVCPRCNEIVSICVPIIKESKLNLSKNGSMPVFGL